MNTRIFTYFTNRFGQTNLLYSADQWVRITLRLETAGPVTVGVEQELRPVLSGKGILLPVADNFTFVLPRGDRLFIAAENTNRVNVLVEPIPWLEQILKTLDNGFSQVTKALGGRFAGIVKSLPGMRG